MFGIGLRQIHYPYLEKRPKTYLDWFEAISENYMDTEGRPLKMLQCIRQDYPVALHGVGLSIASSAPLNKNYLIKLKNLIQHIDPFIVSDHLCWTGTSSHEIHDLLPFPHNKESLKLVSEKITAVQDYLQRPLLIENVSSYLSFNNSDYTEWEFLSALAKNTGCKLLVDVNNIYINATNHHFSASEFILNLPHASIEQIHLAGHVNTGEYLFDTHSRPVCNEVWKLYEELIKLLPKQVPTLMEWDADIPSFEVVEAQVLLAKERWLNLYAEKKPTKYTAPIFTSCPA